MPRLLESCSTALFIPPTIDDLALSRHIVDGFLFLDPLVISFLSLLLPAILGSPVNMWQYAGSNGEHSQQHGEWLYFG